MNFDLASGAFTAISELFHPFLITFGPSPSKTGCHKVVQERTAWDGNGDFELGNGFNAIGLCLSEEGDRAEAGRSKGSLGIRGPKLRDSDYV